MHMQMQTTDENKVILKKVAQLSERIAACDWTPDGEYTVKGKPLRYVTGKKLKRTIHPILNELGILYRYDMADVQPLPACGVKENHVLIRAFVTLTDSESGQSLQYSVISEGADAGDKAVISGAAYAKRLFWITNFDIVDGMENSEDEGSVSSMDVAANLLRQAIPETPAQTPTPTPVQPVAGPTGEPVTSPGEGNIAKMQIRAMDNALAAIKKADEEGRILHEYYERALEIRKKASCKEDVEALLNIKRELGL